MISLNCFYTVKPLIPRALQIWIRRQMVKKIRKNHRDTWPVCPSCANPTNGWQGWPNEKKFALVLTHDIESIKGRDRTLELMNIEKELGCRSSFNFVPERYSVSNKLREEIEGAGFEVGVHGLNHDGKLFATRSIFQERSKKINSYLKLWGAVGFRAPSMHHNLEWIADLDIIYDMSTFDTDPFEPQSDGVETIFPFQVYNACRKKSYIEMPYTLAQDFTLFILLKVKDIGLWQRKLDWIADHGGMALINTHPDYMNFSGKNLKIDEYHVDLYRKFLEYVKFKYEGKYWHVLPKEAAQFWQSQQVSNDHNIQVGAL